MTQTESDHWIARIIDERDTALAQNREFEHMVASQDVDLKAAATTIRHLCANVEAKDRIIDCERAEVARLSALAEEHANEIDRLRTLITDAYNVHFYYCQGLSDSVWMDLFISTLAEMKAIAEEKK